MSSNTDFGHARVSHQADVCVVGGGMSGLCAAIASARGGARTVLIHDRPVLGGNASSEVRMWICGAHGEHLKETGILEETQLDNQTLNPGGHYSLWDVVLWSKAAYQPNLTLLLNCSCLGCDTETDMGESAISRVHAWQLTTQTYHDVEARVFIDCSGDSVLAPSSGAAFRVGRESREEFGEDIAPETADERTMGNTLLIQLRRTDAPVSFTAPNWAYKFDSPDDIHHRMKGVQGHNFWWIELGGFQDTIRDAEAIRDELYRTAWGVWDYIKNRCPDRDKAQTWALEWLGSLPGKRENRRYEGEHILTQHDVRGEGRFDDVVAYGGWSMDDHHPAGLLYPGHPTIFHPAPSPYGIPYRCLYSRSVRNLMMAGRNISVTHTALSSTRVMATCAVIGQATGTAAALATRHGLPPSALSSGERLGELQRTLMDDDCFLPWTQRPIDELTRSATIDDEALRSGVDRPWQGESHAADVAVGQPVELKWGGPQTVGGVRLVFDSNLNHDKRMPYRYPQKTERSGVPACLVRSFRVETFNAQGVSNTAYRVEDNHQRLVRVPIGAEASGVRLVVESTWGGADTARVFAFEATRAGQQPLPTAPDGPNWQAVVAATDPAELADPDHGIVESHPDPDADHPAHAPDRGIGAGA
ncbi:MAG: FAD-dependent oxidoreductase [Planctomycetota bacterium]